MSVAGKLVALVLFVALVPLTLFALTVLRLHEGALDADVVQLHRSAADTGARSISAMLASSEQTTDGLARAIPWPALTDDERVGALQLLYRELGAAAGAWLVDGQGAVIDGVSGEPGHPQLSPEARDLVLRAAPLAEARRSQRAIGAAIVGADSAPVVPLVFALDGGPVLVVALSLRPACARLVLDAPDGIALRLEDASGGLLCGPPRIAGPAATATAETAAHWHVIAEQPAAKAMESLHRLRIETLYWCALGACGAICAGLLLAQVIRRPLRRLAAGAAAIARGEYGYRIGPTSTDEFGRVAATFDRMSAELERKTVELQALNHDLQARVDARTAELVAAQQQLVEVEKLGAVAVLTAGVAHELNNPLAGVLGLAQILRVRPGLDEVARGRVESIEREANRMREIIERMSRVARESVGEAQAIQLAELVDAALAQRAAKLAEAGVTVDRAVDASAPAVRGNAAQLQEAIGQLVDNAIQAMAGGGTLRVAVRGVEGELVALEVGDTGRGIPPELHAKIFEPFFTTKQDWRSVGLGLAVAQRIAHAHHGRIRVASDVGRGTTMTLTVPAARQGAHLV
ncbi:MAG TPA: ATP-binding protein [Kofleriaceae bacterium]|jgi:signal transduction histidine kinase